MNTNKVAAVIALGPNDVTAVCLLYNTMEAARAGLLVKGFTETDLASFPHIRTYEGAELEQVFEDETHPATKALFTRYYGGCGFVYALLVREIEFDTVFHTWDLD